AESRQRRAAVRGADRRRRGAHARTGGIHQGTKQPERKDGAFPAGCKGVVAPRQRRRGPRGRGRATKRGTPAVAGQENGARRARAGKALAARPEPAEERAGLERRAAGRFQEIKERPSKALFSFTSFDR